MRERSSNSRQPRRAREKQGGSQRIARLSAPESAPNPALNVVAWGCVAIIPGRRTSGARAAIIRDVRPTASRRRAPVRRRKAAVPARSQRARARPGSRVSVRQRRRSRRSLRRIRPCDRSRRRRARSRARRNRDAPHLLAQYARDDSTRLSVACKSTSPFTVTAASASRGRSATRNRPRRFLL